MRKAACLFINPLTAFCFIDLMEKHNSKSAISTAASSVVGRIFTRLCEMEGYNLINTIRSDKYIDELQGNNNKGRLLTVVTSKENFKEELSIGKRELEPTIAFDCIGGEMTGNILSSLMPGGVIYHYGNMSMRNMSNISTHDILFNDKSIKGFWLMNLVNRRTIDKFASHLGECPEMYDLNIKSVYNPGDFEAAIKDSRVDAGKGKVLFDFL